MTRRSDKSIAELLRASKWQKTYLLTVDKVTASIQEANQSELILSNYMINNGNSITEKVAKFDEMDVTHGIKEILSFRSQCVCSIRNSLH